MLKLKKSLITQGAGMGLKRLISAFVAACILICPTLTQSISFSPVVESKTQKINEDKRGSIRAILWEEPTDIESRDLFYGIGGQEGAPHPSDNFTFIRRSTSGTQKKIIVKDDKGREWTVKFGAEARPETLASRFVWAVGYFVDQNYFVKSARIHGWKDPDISDVRFERRDEGFKEVDNWSWKSNPFIGSREFEGLKVLMALLKNWDLKTDNNKIVSPVQKGEDQT